jgi:hypothetical protein
MELKSFRELLLKKAADNPTLQTIIDVMKDDLIAEKVIESLEKMARPQASMGRSANAAITAFGNQMKNKDVEMMRDALSHHINHYRAALKAGKREVADQHLNKIIPMMHLAARAASHSGGQLGLDYIPLEPWETNYTTTERRPETGKLKEGTKGLRRRLNSVSRDKNPRSVPDYRYLEMAPHEEHADSKKSPHKGGYPFEEIQIGNPAKIDAKEAYLDLRDVDPQDKFTPHPFDEHPIHELAEEKQDSLRPEHMEDFAKKMADWHTSEHNAKWMQSVKDLHAKNPIAFKERGKKKPAHHYEGIDLLPQPHKAKSQVDVASLPPELAAKFGNKVQPAPTAEAPAQPAAPQPEVKPAAPAGLAPEHLAHLPAALRDKFGGKK